ncbi:hypothetical protein JHK82_028606 [Glycine max]|nr:hypothetical protein JHK87_028515 [Glycine soja]KAG4997834.1 hypothetical protein JHK85_029273 [Glycine max]KAG5004589.1 hypothetical protein JHK86_028728 [Glycine max]KAG5127771.1 hypothetical protein JHK82_028606 [Glycine max]KAG5152384.1 hypothetical protein JHK84_028856 [Glycine max]
MISSASNENKTVVDMDDHLAGLGYKVRSSELCQVAANMERLENVISSTDLSQLASDTTLYDPSNIGLGSWVDTLLSEFDQTASLPLQYDFATDPNHNKQLALVTTVEEDSGIRLVHMLMTCADSVQRGDFSFAGSLIENMQGLLAHVNTNCGIGKVAGYFIDALRRRISNTLPTSSSTYENDVLYHNYYEACPYLKFAHFTANQAILEAFNGHDCVHVIDFNLMQGLQWPALIQALALRPGGPPLLRLTGVGPPSAENRDNLREIGLRLAELARSVNVRFAFRGVAAWRLEDVKPWMLQVSLNEAVAVNSIMQLHRVTAVDAAVEEVLSWIRSLNPKIVTVVEQEANHNGEGFLERFTEALHYYSTVFDSLDACPVEPDKAALAEMYLQREICNVVCCEGPARLERHEPLAKWRDRLGKAGFRPLHLGFNAYKQASMLLTLFSAEGFCVQENQGSLTLGWHSRPLIAASAWQAAPLRDDETLRFGH